MILALAIAAMAAFAGVYTVEAVLRTYTPILYADHWNVVDFLRPGHLTLGNLWSPHNEHRYFIGNLLAIADIVWFHGRNISLYIEIFLIQAAHLLVFAWLIRRFTHFSRPVLISLLAFVFYAMFSPLQLENFTWAFQTGFVLVGCAATICFASAAWYTVLPPIAVRKRRAAFIVCVLAALVAEASLANGVLVWPLLILMGLMLGFSKRDLLIALGACIAGVAIYMVGYHSPANESNPLAAIHNPGAVVKYVITYLASSWDKALPNYSGFPTVFESLTVCAIIGAIFGAFSCLRNWRKPAPLRAFLYTNMLFVLGTATLTALGGLNYGYHQAISSRYQTFALLFWACWAMLAATHLGEVHVHWRRIAAAQALVLALLLAACSRFGGVERLFVAREAGMIEGYDALASGDVNNSALLNLFAQPDRLPGYLAILREYGAGPPSYVPMISGPNIGAYNLIAASECLGHIDRFALDGPSGYAVAGGWAWNAKDQRPFDRIVIASSRGAFLSGTSVYSPRADVPANTPQVTSNTTGWNISFRAPGPGPYTVFGLLGHDQLACQIGKPFTLHK